MPRSPENMTPEQRLQRIRTLERKVSNLQQAKDWAEHDAENTRHWAEEAWTEVRRLSEVCRQHWETGQQIRLAAGLDRTPSLVPLAKFNHETNAWEPIDA